MAKKKNNFWLFGILGLGYLLFNKGVNKLVASFQYKVSIENFKFGFKTNGISADINVDITNSSPIPITVSSVLGSISYGRTPILPFSSSTSVIIGPGETSRVSLHSSSNVVQLGSNIVAALSNSGGIRLSVKGTATVNGVPFPIDQNIINIF